MHHVKCFTWDFIIPQSKSIMKVAEVFVIKLTKDEESSMREEEEI